MLSNDDFMQTRSGLNPTSAAMTIMLDALVVSPHPDDAELGMGGTIVRLLQHGWQVGILDLTTGELKIIPINYAGDINVTGWASDDRILATATPMRAHIWRFRPTP